MAHKPVSKKNTSGQAMAGGQPMTESESAAPCQTELLKLILQCPAAYT